MAPTEIGEIRGLYSRLKSRDAKRDGQMEKVLAVREGRMRDVYRDLFPEGPYEEGIVANMIDVAARDLAETIAPLPTFNCSNSTMTEDRAKKSADLRTKIVNGYLEHCKLGRQMYGAADRYLTYGFAVGMVEIDAKARMPRIQWKDSLGAHVLKDRWGEVEAAFFCTNWTKDELLAVYPEVEGHLHANGLGGSELIEVVRYHSPEVDILFQPGNQTSYVLERAANPVGKCLVKVVERPQLSANANRGQFDDVLAVQVAKARFALLSLEATTKAVQAPTVLPTDTNELSFGPDSIIRTQFPEGVKRLSLDVPNSAFAQQGVMDNELQQGSRYSNARTGDIDGSVITGKGVEALMVGFDTQIRTAQAMFAIVLTDLIELCLEVDEKLWPNYEKEVRGNANGTPYSVTYTPSKHIKGNFNVDVQYGLMAGLDPNRALVFGLQALGADLVSHDWLRRQMPLPLDASEEASKVMSEKLRDGLLQAVMAYSQSIPAMAEQGMDVSQALQRMATVVSGAIKGRPIEDMLLEVFAPEEPQTPPPVEPSGAEPAPVPGSPEIAAPGGGPAPAGPPGSLPPVQNLLAGLTGAGKPSLAANVQRRIGVG